MCELRRYRPKPERFVVAVPLRLDTNGFEYRKWGSVQHCKPGDWLVDNEGEIYTVDEATFASSYREVSRGVYTKVTPVWAREVTSPGHVSTKEGRTHYEAGDYLVFNCEDGTDGYAMPAAAFHSKYEPDE